MALLLLVPGVLAAARLTSTAAPRLTWWAVGLLVPAYIMLGSLVTGDAYAWSAHNAGLSEGTTTRLLDHTHPALNVAIVIFVVGHVVGTVLLGLALLRSRRVHPAFAWAVTISQPLHFVAYVVLGVQPLDVGAWLLTTIGMGAAAWALLRSPTATSVAVAPTELAHATV